MHWLGWVIGGLLLVFNLAFWGVIPRHDIALTQLTLRILALEQRFWTPTPGVLRGEYDPVHAYRQR